MLMRPQPSLTTNNGEFSAISQKINADYLANQSLWQTYWTEAARNCRLESGDASIMGDNIAGTGLNSNRSSYYFNRTRPLLNMVSGHQIRNRKSTIVVPDENADQETADQWTKIMMKIFDKENVYTTISDAFYQGACVAGLNILHVYLDFQNDPINGDVKVDNLTFNEIYLDPYFRKPDLSDCGFIWRRSYLSHAGAASLMPDEFYDEIMSLPGNPAGMGRDGRFQYMEQAYGQSQVNRLAYDEYWYKDYRKQELLVDKVTGETFEITNQSDLDVKRFLDAEPNITLIKQTIPTVRLAIMIQDRVFYDGPNPLNIDRYPFVGVFGYYNPMLPNFYSRIQSIATSLVDPQILLNRRIILSADMLESQVNSGWIFKENAPVDVKHLFQTGQGRVIPLKKDAQMTDIQQIIPPQIPPSFFQLQETFSKELSLVSGINEELMGFNYDEKSGYRSVLQQNAGLTTLAPLFSRLDTAQCILGDVIMEVIRKNQTPGKIKNMLEGQEPAPLFYNKSFGKYRSTVELGYNTETQRQLAYAQLMEMKNSGIQIPDEWILETATIQNKNVYMQKAAQQAQQLQQMQQQQAASQMELQKAQAKYADAKAFSEYGSGTERLSRVEENKALAVERRAEANKDDEIATLNKIKAVKELESLEYAQLEKLISLVQALKGDEVAQRTQAEPQ